MRFKNDVQKFTSLFPRTWSESDPFLDLLGNILFGYVYDNVLDPFWTLFGSLGVTFRRLFANFGGVSKKIAKKLQKFTESLSKVAPRFQKGPKRFPKEKWS